MESPRKPTVLEVNLISAQDLVHACKSSKMQTYVIAWINPRQKLTSRVDVTGNHNPTWNDKFIFAIDGDQTGFGSSNSTMVFEIYRVRRFMKDKRIGVVRVLVDNLMGGNRGCDKRISPECMAFHVRDSSAATPQGILNIGVLRLDDLFHQAMPAFLGSSLAVDYRKLMGGGKKFR